MNRIDIVFSDLDGTFVATDKTIPKKNLELLERLHAEHIPFVPCTGRNFEGVSETLRNHKATKFVVSANGACVYEAHTNALLHSVPLGWKRVLWMYEQLQHLDITFDIFTTGKVLCEKERYNKLDSFPVDPHNLALIKQIRTPVDLLVPQMQEHFDTVDRITIIWKNQADRDTIMRVLGSDASIVWTQSGTYNLEISDAQATKGTALAWLCEHLDIPLAYACAFGDAPNDVAMLETAGIGVAMCNASPAVQCVSGFISGATNSDAGVAQFVNHYLDWEAY